MKKALLFLLFFATMSVAAQTTFDETDLIGTWKTTSIKGTLPLGIKNFSGLILGETIMRYEGEGWSEEEYKSGFITSLSAKTPNGDNDYESEDVYLLDFFISNGNKLHIIIDDQYSLRFVIEELTGNTLRLRSFGGSNSTITLSRDGSSGVRPAVRPKENAGTKYDLSGRRLGHTHQGTIYIENGVKKVAVTPSSAEK